MSDRPAYNLYLRSLLEQGVDEQEARRRTDALFGASAAEPRAGGGGGFGRGLVSGGREAIGSLVGGVGALAGGQTTVRGRQLQRAGRSISGDFEAQTGAERAGRLIGRIGGELGTAVLGGGLALRAARGVPAVARALEGTSRLKRGAAYAAAGAPIDVLQGAQYEEGMLLPGRLGSIAENVAISGAAGALLPPIRRVARAQPAIETPSQALRRAEPVAPDIAATERLQRVAQRTTRRRSAESEGIQSALDRAAEQARRIEERRRTPGGRIRQGRIIQGAPSGQLSPEELASRQRMMGEVEMISRARASERLAEAAGLPTNLPSRILGPQDDPELFARMTRAYRQRARRDVPPAFETLAPRGRIVSPDEQAIERLAMAAETGEVGRLGQQGRIQGRIDRAFEAAQRAQERRTAPTGRVRGGRTVVTGTTRPLEPEEIVRRQDARREVELIRQARINDRLAEAAGQTELVRPVARILGPEEDPSLFARMTRSMRPRAEREVPAAFESEAGRVRPTPSQVELFSALGGAGLGAIGGALAGSQEGDVQQAGIGSILGGALGGAFGRGLGARGIRGIREAAGRLGELSPRVPAEAAEQAARVSEDIRPGGVLDEIRVATGPRQLPKQETLLNFKERVFTDVFDSTAPILKVARSAGRETAERLDDYIAVSAGYGKAAERLIDEEIAPIVRELYEAGGDPLLQKFRQAAIARRAAASGLNVGLSPQQINAAIAEIDADPLLKNATDRLHNFFRRLLEERRAAGLISEDDYARIINSDDYYTPFMVDHFTLGKNLNAKAGGNWNVTDKGVRSIIRDPNFERAYAITDPLEVAISQAVTTLRDTGRARVMSMIDELVDSPLGSQFIRRKKYNPSMPMGSTGNTFQAIVNGKKVAYEVSDPDLLRSIAGQSDLSQNVLMEVSRKLAALKRGGIVAPPDFALLSMLRDMSAYAIQRTDTGRALTEAGLGAAAGAGIGLATAEEGDDLFGRVLVSGSIGAGLGMVARPAAEILQAVGDIVGNKDLYKEWLRRGGSSEGFYIRQSPKEADKILKAMKQSGISMSDVVTPARWYDALMFIGSVAEQAPRLARARTVLGENITSATPDMWARAVKEGQDISVRFARRGGSKLTRDVASISPFWNAGLQGWVKVGQMVTNPRVAAQAGAVITAPSIALWYVNKDNPEYWERPQWERDLFWLVPKGDGGFYRVPKPFQIGTIFATLPERLLSYAAETGQISSAAPRREFSAGQAALDAARIAIAEPLSGTLPTPAVADLLLSQAVNRDFFTGREIIPQAYRGLPGEMQATPRTSAAARAVGQATGFSPLRTDKLIRDLFGTGGTRISEAIVDPVARLAGLDAPVQRARDIGAGPALLRTTGLQRFVTKEYDATETEYLARQRLDDLSRISRGLTQLRNERRPADEIRAYTSANEEGLRAYRALNRSRIALDRITAQRRDLMRRRDITPERRDELLERLRLQGDTIARRIVDYGIQ